MTKVFGAVLADFTRNFIQLHVLPLTSEFQKMGNNLTSY